jgi:hypothetical protein
MQGGNSRRLALGGDRDLSVRRVQTRRRLGLQVCPDVRRGRRWEGWKEQSCAVPSPRLSPLTSMPNKAWGIRIFASGVVRTCARRGRRAAAVLPPRCGRTPPFPVARFRQCKLISSYSKTENVRLILYPATQPPVMHPRRPCRPCRGAAGCARAACGHAGRGHTRSARPDRQPARRSVPRELPPSKPRQEAVSRSRAHAPRLLRCSRPTSSSVD